MGAIAFVSEGLGYGFVVDACTADAIKSSQGPLSLARRRVNPMQFNWMTIVAVVVIVLAVGFLIMRRKA